MPAGLVPVKGVGRAPFEVQRKGNHGHAVNHLVRVQRTAKLNHDLEQLDSFIVGLVLSDEGCYVELRDV